MPPPYSPHSLRMKIPRRRQKTPTHQRKSKRCKRRHIRNISMKGAQGKEAHRRYRKRHPVDTRAMKESDRQWMLLRMADPEKAGELSRLFSFEEDIAREKILIAEEAILKGQTQDIHSFANKFLRDNLVNHVRNVFEEGGARLAGEFLEQQEPYTPKQLIAWRRKQVELSLAGDFIGWVKKQNRKWIESQKRKRS